MKDQMVIARFRDMVNTSAWKGFNMFPEESYGHRIYVYLLSIWNSLEAIVDANGEKPDIHTHTQEDESTFVACIFTLSICLLCTNSRLQVIKKTKVKSWIWNMHNWHWKQYAQAPDILLQNSDLRLTDAEIKTLHAVHARLPYKPSFFWLYRCQIAIVPSFICMIRTLKWLEN